MQDSEAVGKLADSARVAQSVGLWVTGSGNCSGRGELGEMFHVEQFSMLAPAEYKTWIAWLARWQCSSAGRPGRQTSATARVDLTRHTVFHVEHRAANRQAPPPRPRSGVSHAFTFTAIKGKLM